MDEILIEDKKYVSSKRAAKMTGYAKDYVGQLCREGRVPARLVGRSWYVLEAAIQDHRFGQPKEEVKPGPAGSPTWESPRYEASPSEILPPINQLRDARVPETPEEQAKEEGVDETQKNLQESWQTWFNNFDAAVNTGHIAMTEQPEKDIEKGEENAISIPIHTIYRLPPEELLPRRTVITDIKEGQENRLMSEEETRPARLSKGVIGAIRMTSILIAAVAVVVAVVGSGYLDKYLISNSQARIISGVILYNK